MCFSSSSSSSKKKNLIYQYSVTIYLYLFFYLEKINMLHVTKYDEYDKVCAILLWEGQKWPLKTNDMKGRKKMSY